MTTAVAGVDKKKVLGRGLESLLPGKPTAAGAGGAAPAAVKSEDQIQHLDVTLIDPSPYQTRARMDQPALRDLTESVKQSGVLQPVTVRPVGSRYQLITGERRWRASIAAERKTIPAIVKNVPDQIAAEMTVIENLQRADLNPMEQARAYQQLSERFHLTQEEVARRMGVERPSVANYMRLLRLSGRIQEYVETGVLAFSHARLLAALDEHMGLADDLAESAVREFWSVKRLMEEIDEAISPRPKAEPKPEPVLDPNVKEAQREMERVLGVRVKIKDRKGKGKIVIEYNSLDDFDRIVEVMSGE